MIAPIRSPDEVIAVIRRYQDITDVFRMMKEDLGLTNQFCDNAGGLTSGHTDKILGPAQTKSWGPTTFDLFCELFGIEMHVRVDMDAVKRMEKVWEGRAKPSPPKGSSRISKKMIERVKTHVIADLAKIGNAKRNEMLTAEHRSEIASKAANARWKQVRRAKKEKLEARLNARAARAAMRAQEQQNGSPAPVCPAPNV